MKDYIKKDPLTIEALYYNESDNKTEYVSIRISDRESIERYLIESDGKAIPLEMKGRKYWILLSSINRNILMFRKTEGNIPFDDISHDDMDIKIFEYIISSLT